MSRRAALTEGQQRIYGYICEFMRDNKYPPTIREIQRNFDFKSANSVMAHIKKLKEKGYITNKSNKDGMSARTMQLVDNIMGYHIVETEELSRALANLKVKKYNISAKEAVELLSELNIRIA
jgi:SOS-response transcriptional repressor LexA